MDWYKFYPGDYTADTKTLTMIQHGAYRALMDYQYSTEEPLPEIDSILFRLAFALDLEEQKAVLHVRDMFFPFNEELGGHVNKRVFEEIAKYNKRCKINKLNAKNAGRKSKTNPNDNPEEIESISESVIERQIEMESTPETRNQRLDNKKKNTKKKIVYPDLSQVMEYANSRNAGYLGKQFFDYFNESNWIDAEGKKVLSWKSKFITWQSRNPKPQNIDDNNTAWVGGVRQ